MRVSVLRLVDFRNHAALRLAFTRPFVVFAGENGSGKTNLLEALSLLSPGRGLRRAVTQDLARKDGSGGFSVGAEIVSNGVESRIATQLRPDAASPTRLIRIDETVPDRAEALLDLLRVLWLTPAMDGLFTGPAGDRRKFLDRLVLAVDPGHGRRAADYERAMRQRNRLLSEHRREDAWIAGVEAQMAELGIAIALARAELVALLAGMILEAGPSGPFPQAGLALTSGYGAMALDRPAADLEDAARLSLAEGRFEDRAAGRTLAGPHRGDLLVSHAGKAMPAALSSTGEQKALLVGLVLAHARLVARISGLSPILLLDEIAAHLDPGRRAALFDIVETLGVQAFMTGTDMDLFSALGSRAQFHPTTAEGVGEPFPPPRAPELP
ncbi:recombinase RecF [Aurantimonas sp. Leaf443]|nr:recombinase RecF [Aurantimonas sp. Leaf443]